MRGADLMFCFRESNSARNTLGSCSGPTLGNRPPCLLICNLAFQTPAIPARSIFKYGSNGISPSPLPLSRSTHHHLLPRLHKTSLLNGSPFHSCIL